jgi:flavin reductase (DIM6/NTAB) family NADH-FMN oxidoreductase RutF
VRPPRVAAAPCALECKLLQIIDVRDLDGDSAERFVVLGQVVGVHIDDRFLKDGRLDVAAMAPLARCGYADYTVVEKVFPVARVRLPKPQAAE